MYSETIYLREDDQAVKMQTFVHDDSTNVIAGKRSAMVVLAGGGYLFQANDREGEPVAINYFAAGYNCFLVNYSINDKAGFPRPVQDVSKAIVHIRRNAEKYNVDPEKIYVIGFSAGGHLAASIGTFWAEDWAKADDEKAKLDLLEKYKPLLIKNSILNGFFDEDLYQELCLVLMRCINLFDISA